MLNSFLTDYKLYCQQQKRDKSLLNKNEIRSPNHLGASLYILLRGFKWYFGVKFLSDHDLS